MQTRTLLHAAPVFAALLACHASSGSLAPPTPAPAPTVPAKNAVDPPEIAHDGCFMLARVDGSEMITVHPEECAIATPPCSTFKLPHALIALETGVVEDADAPEPWDGSPGWLESWNRDHSLRTAIRESVLWFFQRTARKIGRERMREYLAAFGYGNASVEGDISTFWLPGGSLAIDGPSQLGFVRKVFGGDLGIASRHLLTVQSAIAGTTADWAARMGDAGAPLRSNASIFAKTGTGSLGTGSVTWWVGKLDGPRGSWVFVSRVRAEAPPSVVSPAVVEGMTALAAAGVL